jgi:alpha-amylase
MPFYLPFAVHNHQPVGNFAKVFKKATQQCYAPFLRIVKNYPSFRFSLHISGPLWEWFEENAPDLIDIIGEMVTRGQIELMAGGFYEPLLPFIPEKDAKEQVVYMFHYLNKRFGVRPKGLWLAERVWTPDIPKLLAPLGIEYTLLDDAHFFNAGLKAQEIHGYFITEKDGYCLYVFPISQRLRYLIPFKPPGDTLAYFEEFFSHTSGHTLTYGDDGEKFGLWPDTKEWVYKKGWLVKFLEFLEENQDKIKVMPLGEYIKTFSPRQRIYLPPAAYEEMMEWTLLPEAALQYEKFVQELKQRSDWEGLRPFVRGGTWDNFLCKYEESNQMHKKMILMSKKVSRHYPQSNLQNPSLARRHLWQAQCNCGYWHGVFGGLYLGNLRSAIYQHLIAAQRCLPKALEIETTDYDCDGHPECLFHSHKLNAYFKPSYGGSLIELDWVEREINLTNVLTRRKEAYHEKIKKLVQQETKEEEEIKTIHEQFKLKEPHLDKYLIYDWHRRYSFLDHFLGEDIDLERFYRAAYYDLGNFTLEPYEVLKFVKTTAGAELVLERQGLLFEKEPFTIKKEFSLDAQNVCVYVKYTLLSSVSCTLSFGTEINLFLPDWELKLGEKSSSVRRKRAIEDINEFQLVQKHTGARIKISSSATFTLWYFPLETVNFSEAGAERNYQGTCFTLLKKIAFSSHKPIYLDWMIELIC